MITNILDFFLPKEIKNLIKINKIHKEVNDILFGNGDKSKIWIKRIELQEIRTKEHKKSIDLLLFIIDNTSLKNNLGKK